MGTSNQQFPRVVSIFFFLLTQFGEEGNQRKQNRPATLKQSEPSLLPNRVNSHTAGSRSPAGTPAEPSSKEGGVRSAGSGPRNSFVRDSSHRKEVSARGSAGHSASPRGRDSGTLADQPRRGQEHSDLTASPFAQLPWQFGYVGNSLHERGDPREPGKLT